MEKSKYLELARQKGWDTKIPQLEDGTYDCDVFGGDDVTFDFELAISGTLYLKDNAALEENTFAHAGIILGNNADTYRLFSDNGDVIIGNDADTCSITGKNVICGDDLCTNSHDVSATDGVVILGKNPIIKDYHGDGIVSATEDIICDDEPSAESN